MKRLSGAGIRRLFLDFFSKNGHEIVPSSSLVPADDPSLLFTNAGMVQFKRVFQGEEVRANRRATSSQKCVRAGGKHNDLENVGYTARHHTFFEMLGNFSFGDYFKEEAIALAWEFLTKELGMEKENLWITVYNDDDEAAELWQEVAAIEPERIVRMGEKDNFWAMGDTGPCGPCSEIHLDQGKSAGCGRPDCRLGCDCDRFLEIWNLVFMQFFRDEAGNMTPLPEPCIDTGMGLERIAAVCQGKTNNFDSDIFAGIMKRLGEMSGIPYGSTEKTDVAMRVIADHSRAAAFLIADGVIPSNERRGYVLRRLIRRSARYGRSLGIRPPFMRGPVQVIMDEMGDVYPELKKESSFIFDILTHEEEQFARTLEKGMAILEEELKGLKDKGQQLIPGAFIFKLYDTYGLPIDIVRDLAKEQGFELDRSGYEEARQEQIERSKAAHRDVINEQLPQIYRDILLKGGVKFTGYEELTTRSSVLALVKENIPQKEAHQGWEGELIVAETPFYAESGGQAGDRGVINSGRGKAEVIDTVKRGDLIVHRIKVIEGSVSTGDKVNMQVMESARRKTAANHTATHLLHAALRKALGEHVKQAGSLVTDKRLRFDFSHFSALSREELRETENIVNRWIMEDMPVSTEVISIDEAKKRGAMALFGEKYGERVRVVSIDDTSMELCGGTHLSRTGEAGPFKILSEASVSSGIRRIEAITGDATIEYMHRMEDSMERMAAAIKSPVSVLEEKVVSLYGRIKQLEKDLEKARSADHSMDIDKIIADSAEVDGVKVVAAKIACSGPKELRETGDRFRDRLQSGVVALGAEVNGKALLVCLVTKDIAGKKAHAGDIVKKMAGIVGGGGGGRPDMAQAGGSKPEFLDQALKSVMEGIK